MIEWVMNEWSLYWSNSSNSNGVVMDGLDDGWVGGVDFAIRFAKAIHFPPDHFAVEGAKRAEIQTNQKRLFFVSFRFLIFADGTHICTHCTVGLYGTSTARRWNKGTTTNNRVNEQTPTNYWSSGQSVWPSVMLWLKIESRHRFQAKSAIFGMEKRISEGFQCLMWYCIY